jgi:hypothetical protein
LNNKYLVKIKGEGKSIVEIFEEYESCIHEGFNLTLDEIAEYLRCTYHHAQQHIKTLRYILITNKIRPHLIKLGKELDSDFLHFFYKRKLFSRSDFEEMFMDQAVIKISYERYFLEDFSSEVRNRLEFIPNHKIFEILGNYLYMEAIPYHKPSQQYRTEKLRSFPQKLLSSKDIEQRRGFSFSVETHRGKSEIRVKYTVINRNLFQIKITPAPLPVSR